MGATYLVCQLILLLTLGSFPSRAGQLSSKSLLEMLRTPLLYTMAGGLALRKGASPRNKLPWRSPLPWTALSGAMILFLLAPALR